MEEGTMSGTKINLDVLKTLKVGDTLVIQHDSIAFGESVRRARVTRIKDTGHYPIIAGDGRRRSDAFNWNGRNGTWEYLIAIEPADISTKTTTHALDPYGEGETYCGQTEGFTKAKTTPTCARCRRASAHDRLRKEELTERRDYR
jgi:hypothetical protein